MPIVTGALARNSRFIATVSIICPLVGLGRLMFLIIPVASRILGISWIKADTIGIMKYISGKFRFTTHGTIMLPTSTGIVLNTLYRIIVIAIIVKPQIQYEKPLLQSLFLFFTYWLAIVSANFVLFELGNLRSIASFISVYKNIALSIVAGVAVIFVIYTSIHYQKHFSGIRWKCHLYPS